MFKNAGFIRKNTPALRKKLEKLGYIQSDFSVDNGDSICTSTATNSYVIIKQEMYDDPNPRTSWRANRIECKTEKKFLELVSQKFK